MTVKGTPDFSSEGRPLARPAPDVYVLPFAAQMVVWATRKQLLAIASSKMGPDDVLSVFHLADWGAIYDPLLAIVEVLAASRDVDQLVIHAVSCPNLAQSPAVRSARTRNTLQRDIPVAVH